ncbi:hypothetical protein DPMN_151673 [Dreissena polymorpha]|uniref:Tyramine beta hydroxylase n=1 Tax=Dreissena polymorpha TaxID=45954 RepID=A0A9D4FFT1_DREPO|nr:hypothetical protein DPMN_151673 [Dreissena polymorpha]
MGEGRMNDVIRIDVTKYVHGLQRVQLLKPEIRRKVMPKNVVVPDTQTTYWWHVAQLPAMNGKHHIVQYEGVIQKGSENLVHHMEVFHCEVPSNQIVPFYSGPGQSEGKPKELEACRRVIGAWAMGATAMELPEEAGFPVGGPGFSPYVMLEVHYNNPMAIKGKLDSSGIRFIVTSTLREHDAGIMELGLEYTNKMAIPPHETLFKLTGYCIEECTEVGLPEGGIFIYASQLHIHLTGRRVYTKHVRLGRELPELTVTTTTASTFKRSEGFRSPSEYFGMTCLWPGDALITTCEDSTLNRDNATIGGFAITDEMCVNYVHYYPVAALQVCTSSVETRALNDFFTFVNKWDLDPTNPKAGDRANYQSIRWTPRVFQSLFTGPTGLFTRLR